VSKDSFEFYLVDVPDYVRVNYEIIIWCDLQEQMNVLVHNFIGVSNHVWGDFYKFRTVIQDITHNDVNTPGGDRLVKTTIGLQVDGYLRNEYEYQQQKIQKAYSIKRVKFLREGEESVLYDQVTDLTTPNTAPPEISDVNLSDQDRNLRRPIRKNLL
jgi:hypothetical protein